MYPERQRGSGGPPVLTQNEFWKDHTQLWLRMCVLEGGLACLALGLVDIFTMGLLGVPDGLINLGLGWGICAKRSRWCAVAAGIYYALSQMLARFVFGDLLDASGTWWFVYVILALMLFSIYGTFTFQTRYREYIARHGGPSTGGGMDIQA